MRIEVDPHGKYPVVAIFCFRLEAGIALTHLLHARPKAGFSPAADLEIRQALFNPQTILDINPRQ